MSYTFWLDFSHLNFKYIEDAEYWEKGPRQVKKMPLYAYLLFPRAMYVEMASFGLNTFSIGLPFYFYPVSREQCAYFQ